jgi:hypothetical protein
LGVVTVTGGWRASAGRARPGVLLACTCLHGSEQGKRLGRSRVPPGVAFPAAGCAGGRAPEAPALKFWPAIGGQDFSAISCCCGSGC